MEAGAPALGWREGAFLAAYVANREGAARLALEADPVASRVEALMAETARWEGPAENLLARLRALADDGERRSLPSMAHHLSNRLRRLAHALRRIGLVVTRSRDRDARAIVIEKARQEASRASRQAGSGGNAKVRAANGDARDAVSRPSSRGAAPPRAAADAYEEVVV